MAQWQDKYVRLQAEFDNYRKRTLKEKVDLVQTGGRGRAAGDAACARRCAARRGRHAEERRSGGAAGGRDAHFTEIYRGAPPQGRDEIEVLDKEFDADFSEAVARFAAGDEKKGKVIDVVQTGYMLGEKVLRFAKVVVGE